MTKPKVKTVNDLSRCLDPLDMDATVIAVIEMSQSSWLVAGIVPGVERQPLKKLAIDEHALLKLLSRWRAEAEQKGHRITRIAVAFEAGHTGDRHRRRQNRPAVCDARLVRHAIHKVAACGRTLSAA